MEEVKCVVVGDEKIGKTSLLITYTSNTFPIDFIPSIFENYCTNMMFQEKAVRLSLWDTQGNEDFDRLRPLTYPQTNVFVVCFSVIDPNTFEHAKTKWIPEVLQHAPEAKIVLVGLKSDLKNDQNTIQKLKEKKIEPISNDQIKKEKEEGKINECIEYIECSSLNLYNVKEAFERAIYHATFVPKKFVRKQCGVGVGPRTCELF
eukprot:TRINITY_DN16514_c0_g1_i1.p1 TRINITY_DN16514_c0_g1~~TRINITY_DN16514_c0_g1_i1.p1  ORF type:complete len:204 (-),score=62.81 TRINITY_DN16514_c0_g1_i1:26-637(-)